MNKLILTLLAIVCAMSAAPQAQASYGFFGSNGSFAIINTNGGGNTYYHMDSGANAAFDGAVLGTFNSGVGNTLVLNGGEIQTFENGGDSVTTPATFFYRIYTTGSPSGGYTGISLSNFSDLGGGNEKRDATAANVNLLSGLLNGNYTIEVFSNAAVDWNGQGGGAAEDTIYASNGGANYKATFTVTPEPSRAMFLGLGLVGMIFRRRR